MREHVSFSLVTIAGCISATPKAGEYNSKETTWFKIKVGQSEFVCKSYIESAARFANKFFKRDDHVYITGHLKEEKFTKKDGTPVDQTVIMVHKLEFQKDNVDYQQIAAETQASAEANAAVFKENFAEAEEDVKFDS